MTERLGQKAKIVTLPPPSVLLQKPLKKPLLKTRRSLLKKLPLNSSKKPLPRLLPRKPPQTLLKKPLLNPPLKPLQKKPPLTTKKDNREEFNHGTLFPSP